MFGKRAPRLNTVTKTLADSGPEGGLRPCPVVPLNDNARMILRVYSGSPAHTLGLDVGWRLLSINGEGPSEHIIRAAEMKESSFLFADAGGSRCFALEDQKWPFGMVAVPWPGQSLHERVASADFDLEDLLSFWREGIFWPYSDLIEPLMTYLSVSPGLAGLLARRNAVHERIAKHHDFTAMMVLGLANALDRNFDAAAFYVNAAYESADRADQGSYAPIFYSLGLYTESLIYEARGDRQEAMAAIQQASVMTPEVMAIRSRVSELTEQPLSTDMPPWTLDNFPVDYRLPAFDPIQERNSPFANVSLSKAIASLGDQELLIIMVMGGYRSNYYYNRDLARLADLHHAFPGTIAGVHVIVAGTYALDPDHRRDCEDHAARLGLPFSIIWDEEDAVSRRIAPAGFPARFMIDQSGKILATELLMDEEGYWSAFSRMSALTPKADCEAP